MKKNIVIIGGLGYIGSVAVNYFLKKKYKVICIDNLLYNQNKVLKIFLKDKNFIFVSQDLRNTKKINIELSKYDNVLILAGLVGDPITKKYKALSNSINYIGIRNLILECKKNKNLKKLIFVSTCSNYGIGKKKLLNEKSNLKPLSYYSKQKVKIENFLIKMKKVHFTTSILRFATAFGLSPRMRFDLTINHFTKNFFYKENLNVYDPNTSRPYCHVLDFARAIERVFTSKVDKIDREIFNVGDTKNNYSKKKIIDKISKHINQPKVLFLKKGVDRRDYRVDFSKIKKKLNFKTKYSIEYGIKEIFRFLKKNKKLKNKLKNLGNYKINNKFK